MSGQLLYPMFAMFLLTFIVAVIMFMTRVQAVKGGQLKIAYFRLYNQNDIPDKVIQTSRHFSNLFEAPVLFYVACILGMILSQGFIFTILAWLYVAARVIHAYVHMGSNRLRWRMNVYGLSWLILIGMWGLLMWSQLMASSGV